MFQAPPNLFPAPCLQSAISLKCPGSFTWGIVQGAEEACYSGGALFLCLCLCMCVSIHTHIYMYSKLETISGLCPNISRSDIELQVFYFSLILYLFVFSLC